jgi:hypothetical protein
MSRVLSILFLECSSLCLEEPGESTGASTLVLLDARCRGGGGGGAKEERFVGISILETEGDRFDCRVDGIRINGGIGDVIAGGGDLSGSYNGDAVEG